MTARFANALFHLTKINPAALAADIVKAWDEIAAEPPFNTTAAMRDDKAVRLMVYRLALICDLQPKAGVPEYDRLVDACQEYDRRTKEGV